jgi:hypothetical protein
MAIASLGMLYHYISTLKSPARPIILRERLEYAVQLFPDNTILLGMFLEMQRGQGLWGRVQKLGDSNISGDIVHVKSVSRCAAEIWLGGWEKDRWFWEVERIRSRLTAAIENERCVSPEHDANNEFETFCDQHTREPCTMATTIGAGDTGR